MSDPKDFIDIADWSRDALEAMLVRAEDLRQLRATDRVDTPLSGRSVLLYFEKPSLRTYVTFGVGISELGGMPIYLPPGQGKVGGREPTEDVARNLSRWCHAVIARTFSHQLVVDLGRFGTIPVINALTDYLHPCQAMADVLTITQHGDRSKDRLVYIGDGNNMAQSLIQISAALGMRLTVCTPADFKPDGELCARALDRARQQGADLRFETDPSAAVKDAAFIYTDVWASMGQEAEASSRDRVFRPYQVNAQLLAQAPQDVRILHCLPAHRGDEITADVLDSDRALVFDQAENRLHAQKAILERLMKP